MRSATPCAPHYRRRRPARARETSVADDLAVGTSCARVTAMLPLPVPMSATRGRFERARSVQHVERFLDDEFRFGPRDEDRRRHGEIDAPELPDADDVRGRFARRAPRDPLRERRFERGRRFAHRVRSAGVRDPSRGSCARTASRRWRPRPARCRPPRAGRARRRLERACRDGERPSVLRRTVLGIDRR